MVFFVHFVCFWMACQSIFYFLHHRHVHHFISDRKTRLICKATNASSCRPKVRNKGFHNKILEPIANHHPQITLNCFDYKLQSIVEDIDKNAIETFWSLDINVEIQNTS